MVGAAPALTLGEGRGQAVFLESSLFASVVSRVTNGFKGRPSEERGKWFANRVREMTADSLTHHPWEKRPVL